MKQIVIAFGLISFSVIALLSMPKYFYFYGSVTTEIIIAFMAVVAFLLGIYMTKNSSPRSITASPSEGFVDHEKIKELGLSRRELEILCNISEGLSNRQIADRLFVSENTVKKHVSSVLVKLHAERRTQAVKNAQALNILP